MRYSSDTPHCATRRRAGANEFGLDKVEWLPARSIGVGRVNSPGEWGPRAVVVLAEAGSRPSMAVDSAFPIRQRYWCGFVVPVAEGGTHWVRSRSSEVVREDVCLLAPLCPHRHDGAYAERLVVPAWLVSSPPRL